MRTYYIAQETLLSDLWWPKWEGNLKKGDTCVCMTDSLCCTAETYSTLQSNYTPKKGGGATMALAEKTETLPEQCVAP